MHRRRITERYPWLLPIRRKQRKMFFYIGMLLDGNHYAGEQTNKTLPVTIFQSSCPVCNHATGFDMIYQENKLHNLKLAAEKIDGLLIKTGETFSFWNRVKDADKKIPYREALSELNGILQTEYGGGLCQISNMLNWVFPHSPLTITERHGHIEYIKCGDYFIPDLRLPPQPKEPLTKYGRMRKNFLKDYRPVIYNMMLLDGTLKAHCLDIQEQAQHRMEVLVPRMAKAAGVTEELKRTDQMKWVGLMNNIHAAAEEIVREEIIFS